MNPGDPSRVPGFLFTLMPRKACTRSRFKESRIDTPVDGALRLAVIDLCGKIFWKTRTHLAGAGNVMESVPIEPISHEGMALAVQTLSEDELLTYSSELIAMQGSWPEALRATPEQKARAFYRAKHLK